jgi:hypothetical protein
MTTSRVNYLDTLQTLAAYVALPAVLLYPFGFLALFVQFTKYFGLDFYTAWYAASLVNRMVVIGQGATILVIALLGSVLLTGKISQILLRHENRTGSSRFISKLSLSAKLGLLFAMTLILYVLYSRILAGGRVTRLVIEGKKSTECRDNALRHQLDFWPDSLIPALLFFAGSLWGGWLVYRSYQNYRESVYANQRDYPAVDYRLRLGFFNRGVTQRWILPGLMAAYAVSIVASLILAMYTPAFMPYMTYGPTQEYHGDKEPTHNRFLSQAEGQWHFLHRIENKEGEREYRVVALAGGEVKHVRVTPSRPRAARVAPLPLTTDYMKYEKCPPAPP